MNNSKIQNSSLEMKENTHYKESKCFNRIGKANTRKKRTRSKMERYFYQRAKSKKLSVELHTGRERKQTSNNLEERLEENLIELDQEEGQILNPTREA